MRIRTTSPFALLPTLLATSLPASTAPAFAQETTVVVSFTERRVDARDGSVYGPQRQVTATLRGGNRIADRDERYGRRRFGPEAYGAGHGRRGGGWRGGRRGGWDTSNEGTFAGEFQPLAGRGATGQWRVGRNNTLVRTIRYRFYSETISISLAGGGCQARVSYTSHTGGVFFTPRGPVSSIRAENVICAISGG